MSQIVVKQLNGVEKSLGGSTKRTEASIWKEVIENLIDPTTGMEEPERKNYENKIIQKMKTGKRLTSEELDYLRIHNPDLYRTAMRVENARKALRTKLKSCKSKEEVQQTISVQMEVLQAMKDDPDREYMTAMVKEEIQKFKKSSAYARLPLKREEGKEKSKCSCLKEDLWEKEMDEEIFSKVTIYSRMQIQCDTITQIAQGFV